MGQIKCVLVVLFTVLTLFSTVDGNFSNSTTRMNQDMQVAKAWEKMEQSLKSAVDNMLKQVMPFVLKASKTSNISGDCAGSLLQFILGLRRMTPWAFRMLDASGKPPPGMLKGTVTALGAYDECLAITVPEQLDPTEEYFRGQYCSITVVPPMPPKIPYYTLQSTLDVFKNFSESGSTVIREISRVAHLFYFLSYRLDVCVPSKCTKLDLEKLINTVTKNFNIEVSVSACSVQKELEVPSYIMVILIIMGILIALAMAGAVLDFLQETFEDSEILKRYTSNKFWKFLNIFSLVANIQRILDTKVKYPKTTCLYGMTFFSMTWMILASSYFEMNLQIFSNLFEMTQFSKSFAFQVVINATLSYDTVFFISGVLTMFLTMSSLPEHNGCCNLVHYFARVLWRFLPPYAIMIAVFLVMACVGDGPSWNLSVTPMAEKCEARWWTNLLFINNFYDPPETRCLKSSWYFACLMQLYAIALLVIIPLVKWPIVAMGINAMLVLISIVLNGLVTHLNNYPPTLLMAHPDPGQRSEWEYGLFNQTFCHLGPFCIGLAVGYILFNFEKIKFKWYQLAMGWVTSVVCSLAIVYGVYDWNNGIFPNDFVTILYSATHRTVWACALAWVTIVCAYGQGGYVNGILSWKPFIPLSRLTLIVYLLHPMMQLAIVGYLQERIYTTHTMAIFFFLGQLACSYGLAFILTLLFERPFLVLRKMALNWPMKFDDDDEEEEERPTTNKLQQMAANKQTQIKSSNPQELKIMAAQMVAENGKEKAPLGEGSTFQLTVCHL